MYSSLILSKLLCLAATHKMRKKSRRKDTSMYQKRSRYIQVLVCTHNFKKLRFSAKKNRNIFGVRFCHLKTSISVCERKENIFQPYVKFCFYYLSFNYLSSFSILQNNITLKDILDLRTFVRLHCEYKIWRSNKEGLF